MDWQRYTLRSLPHVQRMSTHSEISCHCLVALLDRVRHQRSPVRLPQAEAAPISLSIEVHVTLAISTLYSIDTESASSSIDVRLENALDMNVKVDLICCKANSRSF